MNVLGHLRRAWIRMQDGAASLEAAAGAAYGAGPGVEGAPLHLIAPAARRARETLEIFRPALEHVERNGNNDNGETPLELARDALHACRRFSHCMGKLTKLTDSDAANAEPLERMAKTEAGLERVVEELERLEGLQEKKAPPP